MSDEDFDKIVDKFMADALPASANPNNPVTRGDLKKFAEAVVELVNKIR